MKTTYGQHPTLLRIARGDAELARKYKDFNRAVRGSLRGTLPRSSRLVHATAVLRTLGGLELHPQVEEEFLLEWLRQVAPEIDSPVLSEAYAAAELTRAELKVQPGDWVGPPPKHWTEHDLPCFESSPWSPLGQPALHVPRDVYQAWTAVIDGAIVGYLEHTLPNWTAEECFSALRVLVLVLALGTSHTRFRTPDARLAFAQGIGIEIWKALADRIQEDPSSQGWQYLWSERCQGKVLLHLRGLLRSSQISHSLQELAQPATEALSGDARGQSAGELVVVKQPIPPSTDKTDAQTIKMYAPLLKPMPLASIPGLARLSQIVDSLCTEFPWAPDAIAEISDALTTRQMLGVRELRLSPLLLVGPPGSGKSRLVRRMAELLGVPYMPVSCGASGDSKVLSGTTRGWATGEPSPILRLLVQHRSASAMVLLDEIDKINSGVSNSPPLSSVLLGLLEPETARRWHDGFLQTGCDLSGVNFLATANGVSGLPRPLLSRFTIVHVPAPRRQHQLALAKSMTEEIAREWGLPAGVLPEPTDAILHGKANAREMRRAILRYINAWAREHLARERLH